LPFGIHPVSGVTAVIGGLALAGVARGVRLGYRRAWLAALILLLASTVYRLTQDVGLEGSGIACLIGLWLLLEHRHFRVSPSGFRRVLGWVIMTSLVVVALAAGLGAAYLSGGEREKSGPGRSTGRERSSIVTAATHSTTSPCETTSPGFSPGTLWSPT